MVLSQVRWGSDREDNNNSIKRDILRTPPHGHGHSRCMFYYLFIFLVFCILIFQEIKTTTQQELQHSQSRPYYTLLLMFKYETKYFEFIFLIAKLLIHV